MKDYCESLLAQIQKSPSVEFAEAFNISESARK